MYVDNTYNGLPWMFRENGYSALAFHGYVKTFWNRSEAYKNQGFQHYYSEEELKKHRFQDLVLRIRKCSGRRLIF